MAQERFHNYEAGIVSFTENRRLAGILSPGRYYGFDTFVSTGTLTFKLQHLEGFVRVDIDQLAEAAAGIFVTPQGTIVTENDEITGLVVITNVANAFERIDAVIANHYHTETGGGAAATYSVIQGATGGPVAPALTSPETQVLLGYLYVPASATNLTSVTYIPAEEATLAGVNFARRNAENTFTKTQTIEYTPAGQSLIAPNASDELVLTDGNIFAVEPDGANKIAKISSKGAGTEITLLFTNTMTVTHDASYIDLGRSAVAGDYVVYINQTLTFIETGDDGLGFGYYAIKAFSHMPTGAVASTYLELNAKDALSGSHLTRVFLSILNEAASGKKYYIYMDNNAIPAGITGVYLPDGSGYIPAYKQGSRAWANKAFNAGDFTASSGSWTVAEVNIDSHSYCIIDKTLILSFKVGSSTIAGGGAELRIALPSGLTVNGNHMGMGRHTDGGTSALGYVRADDGDAHVTFGKVDGTSFTVGTLTGLFFTITLEVN